MMAEFVPRAGGRARADRVGLGGGGSASASTASRARSSSSRRHAPLEFESVDALIAFFENAGPQVAAKQALGPELYDEARRRFREIADEFNQADDGSVRIESEYLLVVARKRG